ncbi:hypothetical protein LRAMOSA00781 [Lichtheimia ramosa]|uniref:RGS domain-containing protein n=1 Tax=Lichtheimia ramosa TaxID=688394 RepID=A0A077W9V2_9FUNG|nr:hypothetical protein LRAMOSA00781 [Lichtheimia ramosa]
MSDIARPTTGPPGFLMKRWHKCSSGNTKTSVLLRELPSLDQVLRRQSRPPVCLYNFYIVLRDRLELETLLDFWLDVQQAKVLYKRHIKQSTKKSNTRNMTPPLSPAPTTMSHDQQLTHSLLMLASGNSSVARPSVGTVGSHGSNNTTSTVVTRAAMQEFIEHIYLRYIVPNAEKELMHLPLSMRDAIADQFASSKTGITDPFMVFNDAQHYVHQLLQATWPYFLRYKALMNLTLNQQLGRIAAGLAALLVGFSVEFSLIFLNIQPWHTRIWGVLPIFVGVYCLISGLTGLDPIWVLAFNVSETTTFHFNRIQQPNVRPILSERSIVVLAVCLLITILLIIIFCALPGKRL